MAVGKLLLLCGLVSMATLAMATENEIKPRREVTDDHCKLKLNFSYDITGMQFVNEAKNDDLFDEVFLSFDLPPAVTDDWELDTYHDAKYVQAVVENRTVFIKPTEAFKRFEYVEHFDKTFEERFHLVFHCGDFADKTEFYFVQPITDVNNHAPTFNRKEYKYHFGMPIKAGAQLTSLMEIYAVDVDYTNPKVEFTVTGDDLEISYGGGNESGTRKMHNARLVTKKELAKGCHEYTITVTDEGVPKKKSTALVKIEID